MSGKKQPLYIGIYSGSEMVGKVRL